MLSELDEVQRGHVHESPLPVKAALQEDPVEGVAVGSAQAVTEGGTVVVASLTGSQLGSYTYGAGQVIWIVGAQKIVKDVDLPLESVNTRKKFGLPDTFHTFPSKVLLFNRVVKPGRVIVVNEALGS